MPNPGLEKASDVGGEKTVFGYQLFLHYTLPTAARLRLADNLCNVRRLCQQRRKASVSMSLWAQVARSRAWRRPRCRAAAARSPPSQPPAGERSLAQVWSTIRALSLR